MSSLEDKGLDYPLSKPGQSPPHYLFQMLGLSFVSDFIWYDGLTSHMLLSQTILKSFQVKLGFL